MLLVSCLLRAFLKDYPAPQESVRGTSWAPLSPARVLDRLHCLWKVWEQDPTVPSLPEKHKTQPGPGTFFLPYLPPVEASSWKLRSRLQTLGQAGGSGLKAWFCSNMKEWLLIITISRSLCFNSMLTANNNFLINCPVLCSGSAMTAPHHLTLCQCSGCIGEWLWWNRAMPTSTTHSQVWQSIERTLSYFLSPL